MSCRCDDKKDCKNDIDILNKGLGYINDTIGMDNAVNESEHNLGVTCESTFTADNIGDLQSQINKANDDFTDALGELKKKVTSEISHLEDEYDRLDKEDREYHEKH